MSILDLNAIAPASAVTMQELMTALRWLIQMGAEHRVVNLNLLREFAPLHEEARTLLKVWETP